MKILEIKAKVGMKMKVSLMAETMSRTKFKEMYRITFKTQSLKTV